LHNGALAPGTTWPPEVLAHLPQEMAGIGVESSRVELAKQRSALGGQRCCHRPWETYQTPQPLQNRSPDGCSARSSGWPKSPRALAGRLRRAQTSLRALGIEIAFSREGRGGTRIIRISRSHENPRHDTVSTVTTVIDQGPSKSGHAARQAGSFCPVPE
jgi:hypothetical protein